MQGMTMILMPEEEWTIFKRKQDEILQCLKTVPPRSSAFVPVKYITAKEFMEAVRIKRTKFDQLVQTSKIKVIKKRRKIYVPVAEVERYFSDRSIL